MHLTAYNVHYLLVVAYYFEGLDTKFNFTTDMLRDLMQHLACMNAVYTAHTYVILMI